MESRPFPFPAIRLSLFFALRAASPVLRATRKSLNTGSAGGVTFYVACNIACLVFIVVLAMCLPV